MKKSLMQFLDSLVFVNRINQLCVILFKTNTAFVYKITKQSKPENFSYSLISYGLSDAAPAEKTVISGVSFEHLVLTCAVMAKKDCCVLVDPKIAQKKSGCEFVESTKFMGKDFSFVEQTEPFSAWRLVKELAIFPFWSIYGAWIAFKESRRAKNSKRRTCPGR